MYTDPPAKVGFGLEAKESVPKRSKSKIKTRKFLKPFKEDTPPIQHF